MLAPRLQTIADLIFGPRHADIGSDHALLPLFLCTRLQQVIVVEKNPGPLARSRQALAGHKAEVRAGDGLGPLAPGEVDSLSISGMGALNIRRILAAHPDRRPPQLLLQPMDSPQPLRQWAFQNGLQLVSEHWRAPHTILEYRPGSDPDPAYQNLPLDPAFHYGPYLLKALTPAYRQHLTGQLQYLESLDQPHLQPRIQFLTQHLDLP